MVSDEVAERLRRRYPPPRVPRAAWIIAVGLGTVIALAWLLWAAWVQSRPAASAQVTAFAVRDAGTATATLTVTRRDPGVTATCRVVAQAQDFHIVGEQDVVVPAGPYEVTNVDVTLNTLRRAVSVSSRGCTSQP
jgi:hypothetical protein